MTPKGRGGWWILVKPELHLGSDVVVPDLAGWRRERMPVLTNTPAFTVAPDWAREDVRHLWIVDPLARTVEVFRLEGGRWVVATVHAVAGPARIEPFDAVELDVDRWWLPAAADAAASRPG